MYSVCVWSCAPLVTRATPEGTTCERTADGAAVIRINRNQREWSGQRRETDAHADTGVSWSHLWLNAVSLTAWLNIFAQVAARQVQNLLHCLILFLPWGHFLFLIGSFWQLTIKFILIASNLFIFFVFFSPPPQKCAFLSYDTVVWSSHLAELVKSSLARPHPDHFLNVFCTTGSWMILCLLRGHAALGAVHVMCHAFFHEAK